MKSLVEAWCQLYLEQKYKVEEMADTIKRIQEKIDNTRLSLLSHLICYYCWSDITTNQHHWEKDIYSLYYQIPFIKGKNKYPTYKQLLDWGFRTTLESIDNQIDSYISYAEDDESLEIPKDVDIVLLKQFMRNYILWLCSQLTESKNGNVTLNEVRDTLRELYNKYKG